MSNTTIAANILKTLETSSSIGMFARDTGGCLISKLAFSRSKDESKEIGFAELSESAVFYFSAPAAARLGADIFSKTNNITKEELTTPFKDLKNITNPKKLKSVKLGKFAQIASTFSLILPLVFAIAPLRNLMTLSKSGKNDFVSVVGLENKEEENKKQEAKAKTKKLAKTLGLTALGALAATGIASGLLKNDKIYKKAEPLLDKTLKHFDFTKTGDLELMHYGALIYPVSIASYFYASRDKYEKAENARRFSITVPLMFFGEKLIEKPIYKVFDKKFGTNVMDNGKIKSYKEILNMPLSEQKQYLKSKNLSYGLTFFINTMAIAGAVALLNRIETKRNYAREKAQNINKRPDNILLKDSIEQWKTKNIQISTLQNSI